MERKKMIITKERLYQSINTMMEAENLFSALIEKYGEDVIKDWTEIVKTKHLSLDKAVKLLEEKYNKKNKDCE